jgi:hypothetical protein
VLSDRELWACANHYVQKHHADAPIVAAMRADELLAAGDLDGARNFQAVVRRINELLETPSGPLH